MTVFGGLEDGLINNVCTEFEHNWLNKQVVFKIKNNLYKTKTAAARMVILDFINTIL